MDLRICTKYSSISADWVCGVYSNCYVKCTRYFIESGEVRFRDGVSFFRGFRNYRLNQIKMREASFAHFRGWSLWKLEI